MRPGAWTSLIITTDGDVIRKLVTKERWKLVQSKVRWLPEQVDLRDGYLNHKPVGSLDETQVPPGKIKFDTTDRFVRFLVSRKKYGGLATNRIQEGQ